MVKSLQVNSVRNMKGVVNRVSVYFHAHPKRQRFPEIAIHETQLQSTVTILKDVCRTCWVQRINALEIFKSLHAVIVLPVVIRCNY